MMCMKACVFLHECESECFSLWDRENDIVRMEDKASVWEGMAVWESESVWESVIECASVWWLTAEYATAIRKVTVFTVLKLNL